MMLTGCDDRSPWAWWLFASKEHHQGHDTCDGHGDVLRGRCVCDPGFELGSSRFSCVPAKPSPQTDERLVVADANEQRLYVIDASTYKVVADFAGIAMADHPGFLPLHDGRLLFVDETSGELQVARITGVSTPVIEQSVQCLAERHISPWTLLLSTQS